VTLDHFNHVPRPQPGRTWSSQLSRIRSKSIVAQAADSHTKWCATQVNATRESELTGQLIELLMQRFPDPAPAWVHQCVDRLLNDSAAFQSVSQEVG